MLAVFKTPKLAILLQTTTFSLNPCSNMIRFAFIYNLNVGNRRKLLISLVGNIG